MVRLSRVTGLVMVVLGSSAFIWLLYIQLHYRDVMPREPDPAAGRVYPYTAARFHIYVSRNEADRGRLAEILGPFGILAAMVGARLVQRAAGRER
jgi:hypothetical protein